MHLMHTHRRTALRRASGIVRIIRRTVLEPRRQVCTARFAPHVPSAMPRCHCRKLQVGAIIGSVKREPITVGKPNDFMLANIANTFGLRRDQICMVGDRLDTDIMFGKQGSLTTCLVLSGEGQSGVLTMCLVLSGEGQSGVRTMCLALFGEVQSGVLACLMLSGGVAEHRVDDM